MRMRRDILAEARRGFRGAYIGVGLFSALVNVLMLTGPFFMLQVYDRVLASQSVPTLIALFALAAVLYLFMGVFDFVRSRILSRVAATFDARAREAVFGIYVARGMSPEGGKYRPLMDMATIRNWTSSPAPMALFDLPWFPFYLGIVALMHPWLGLLAAAGAAVVLVTALLNQWLSRDPASRAAQGEAVESRFATQAQRSGDALLAMGMITNVGRRWSGMRKEAAEAQQLGVERAEGFTSFSKSFRLMLQSAILGLGAYLAIQAEISPGMIVTASIVAGRALAPIDQTISSWSGTQRARISWQRLKSYLDGVTDEGEEMTHLDPPKGQVTVEHAWKMAPALHAAAPSPTPILADINFTLQPGDGLGVIGPSASGKSTLARLLCGLWLPDRGAIRVDGATFQQWPTDQIGPAIGYLPQQVELLSGSIAENIARFDPKAEDSEIVKAAQMAGIHDMVLEMPDGYATHVDSDAMPLSGGQRQQVGLARAIFRMPRLTVLDEPNSNLDAEGDAALANAVQALRADGGTVVVMAHRPSAIAAVDHVLMLRKGQQIAFGPKAEVLSQVTRPRAVGEGGSR